MSPSNTASSTPAAMAQEVAGRVRAHLSAHPRLLLPAGGEVTVRQRIAGDALLRTLWDLFLADAETLLSAPQIERRVEGRRLLAVSREALRRVLTFGLVHRMTGDARYRDAARDVALAAASFSDWNPSHFLDTAEMTAAVAIAYDWLHAELSDADRATLRHAIVEKGIDPSLTLSTHWVTATNNWNQVCHAGITLGALAVADHKPELCARVVERAVVNLPAAMGHYAPDGAYPEGPMYWTYGTTFNVLLISALETALGTDFGLSQQRGFLASAHYYQQMFGPTGKFFNYADCREYAGYFPSPTLAWMAARLNDPSVMYVAHRRLTDALAVGAALGNGETDRLNALLFLWSTGLADAASPPRTRHYVGRGITPVAVHRSSWEPDATFVGIKAGMPGASHGHMDVGSFVLDRDGVRWASDLGMQEYHSLESLGIGIWQGGQGGPRWSVFRLGSMSHNILTVEGQEQVVQGAGTIVRSTAHLTIVDSSPAYAGQLASARRGIHLRNDESVRLQDEITGLPDGPARTVRWAMMTGADVTIDGGNVALLRQGDKQLRLRVVTPAKVSLTIYPADPPPNSYDAPNPGMKMVGFELSLPTGASESIVIDFEKPEAGNGPAPVLPLAAW